jgi:3'-phosphoadenosine 5'-phosphosulfate sulfotransferase (PAPS reductase)/FAD synthetase
MDAGVAQQMELVAEQKHSLKLPPHTRRAKEFRSTVANRICSERAKCKRANRPSNERDSSELIFTGLQRGQGGTRAKPSDLHYG